MAMTDGIWVFVLLGALAVFLVFATIKGWVRWKGGSPIASTTAFHDFQPKDKQEAIEYVIEEKAGKKMEEQESGKNKNVEILNSNPKSQIMPRFK
jgi:hypothetical protein